MNRWDNDEEAQDETVNRWTKFKAYWEELGRPQIEFDCDDGLGWEKENGTPCWSNETEYRIAGDRHWELRLKWVNSDKTIPIEMMTKGELGGFWIKDNGYMFHQLFDYREEQAKKDTNEHKPMQTEGLDKNVAEIEEKDAGSHYRYTYKGIKLDPARIARIYGVTDGMIFTILKKCLRMGRAHKDKRQDLLDIISASKRELEMMDEDEA